MRRIGGLLGPGSKVTESLSELFPVVETENLPAELLFLGGWVIGMNTAIQAATVGQTSRLQVFNPAGSGKIGVITDVYLSSSDGVGQVIDFQVNSTPFAAIFTGTSRDSHVTVPFGTALATGVLATGNTPSAGVLIVPALTTFHHHSENGVCVLLPGSGIEYGTRADNQQFQGTFFWRERVVLPSETNFP